MNVLKELLLEAVKLENPKTSAAVAGVVIGILALFHVSLAVSAIAGVLGVIGVGAAFLEKQQLAKARAAVAKQPAKK